MKRKGEKRENVCSVWRGGASPGMTGGKSKHGQREGSKQGQKQGMTERI